MIPILEGASSKMILGITGHRPGKLGGYDDTKNRSRHIKHMLSLAYQEYSPEWVVSGMALGVDQWAAEIALEWDIKVMALIPCLKQESKWPTDSQTKYHQLLEKIETAGGKIEYVTKELYSPSCMHVRNQRIVDYSTRLLAIWDGTWGGTGSCVRLAKLAGRPVTSIHPTTLRVDQVGANADTK